MIWCSQQIGCKFILLKITKAMSDSSCKLEDAVGRKTHKKKNALITKSNSKNPIRRQIQVFSSRWKYSKTNWGKKQKTLQQIIF